MGRLFVDATPEQEQEFIDQRRRDAFLAASLWPLSWGMAARRHKQAADYLYEVAYAADQRQEARFRTQEWTTGSHVLEGQELADHQDTEMLQEYFLLCGYAFECLLKGILLMRRPELVRGDARLDSLVATHNLSALAHQCDIALDDQEGGLLDVMTRHIVWGKYPGPKDVRDMPSAVDVDDQRRKRLGIDNPFDDRRAQRLVNGLYGRIVEVFGADREEWRVKEEARRLAASDSSSD